MTRLVAEIGSCNGDVSLAIDTAQAAVGAGAWMVKGQMYTADRLVTRDAPTYGHGSIVEPARQYDAFEKALTYDEWGTVAASVPGQFFASVFDLEACDDYPYQWIKIASADITYRALVEEAAMTGRNMIVSTGAANQLEILRMLRWIHGVHPTLMACTLSYPCEPNDANVRRILTMRSFHVPVGYSDHTRGILAARVAFEYGATMVEKHFTIVPGTGGDHDFAIGPNDVFAILDDRDPPSEAVMAVYGGSPILGPRACELSARDLARRSLHAAVAIPSGTVITEEMIDVIRPADGVFPWLVDEPDGPVGSHATRNLTAGDPFTADSFS